MSSSIIECPHCKNEFDVFSSLPAACGICEYIVRFADENMKWLGLVADKPNPTRKAPHD